MNEIAKRLKLVFKNNKIPYPYKIEIWPTQFCNLNCTYCRASDLLPKKDEISDERLLDIVDEAAGLKVKEFIIAGGGEPLMRKHIVLELMDRIKRKNMKGSLTTNGVLLGRNDIERIIKMGWDNLFFSIDGPSAKYNDALRKKGSFRKAVYYLRLLNYFKKKYSVNKPFLGISMVLTKNNYRTLLKMTKMAKKLKINCLVVNPVKGNNTEYNESLKLGNKEIQDLRKALPKIIEYADRIKLQTTLKTLETDLVERSSDKISAKKTRFRCFEPFTSMLINSYGGVGPCCERPDDPNQDFVTKKSLKAVWQGNYFNRIRQSKSISKKCFYCNAWKITDTNQIKDACKSC